MVWRESFNRFSLSVLASCSLAHFVVDGYERILSPITPFIMEEYGLNYTEAGLLNSGLNASAAFLQFFVGFLTLHFKRRSLVTWGLVWAAVFVFSIAVTSSYLQLLTLLILAGVGLSTYHPSGVSLVSDVFEGGNRGKALSIHLFTGKVGMISAVLLAGFTGAFLNWRVPLYLWAVGGLLAALIFFKTVKERDVFGKDVLDLSSSEGRALKTGSLIALTVVYSVYNMFANGLAVFIPINLVDAHGVPKVQASLIVSLLVISGAAGTLLGGFLADRYNKNRLILYMIALSALPTYFITGLELNLALLIVVACLGVTIYSLAPTTQALITEITKPSERAGILGISLTVSVGMGAITPSIMGNIADSFGIGASFHFLVAIAGIGMISALTSRIRSSEV